MQEETDLEIYEKNCNEILKEPEVRFAGLLNEHGELLAGGYKNELQPKLTPEQHEFVCKEMASRIAKRKKFDSELGRVKYSASRREHVVIMSFPIDHKVIMIVAESNVNIDRLAYKIIEKLGNQWGEFSGK